MLYDSETDQLVLTQVEKQNNMHLAQMPLILGIDLWEHAWVHDYLTDRPKYIEAWWNVANWSDADARLAKVVR